MSRSQALQRDECEAPPYGGLAARAVLAPLARLESGCVEVTLPDGRTLELGAPESGPPARLVVRRWRFFRRVLLGGEIGAGEAYMDGDWTCDDLVRLCRLLLSLPTSSWTARAWALRARLANAWARLSHANTPSGSRRNIASHYDLSNDLYRLFLDDTLSYSCAVFEREDATLEEAQRRKMDDICRRLDLAPGMRVLEIGSGWGSFALHAAGEYGCRVDSITLSERQLALARRRAEEAELDSSVDFRLCDYRSVEGRYDRIVSIEMFEAVGFEYYDAFFSQCDRLLTAAGRMFLQTIYMPDAAFEAYRRGFDWIRKYIFPGGLLASLQGIRASVGRRTRMHVEWMRDIGLHYVPTLRGWRERFLDQRTAVRGLGFDERFMRMWEFYLASCEAAFAEERIGDAQMILAKPSA